jgi:putative flippase GtrA
LADNVVNMHMSPFLDRIVRLPVINRLGLEEHPQELVRFIKFAIVGVSGMVVDLSTLTFSREVLGLPLSVAVLLGFSLAVLSNFTWNRLWTFPESRNLPLGRQLIQFTIVNIIGLGINELVVLSLHPVFSAFLHDPAAYLVAKIIAIGIVLFWNFFVNRIWTYRDIH